MEILSISKVFSREDEKKHFEFPFILEKNYKKLVVKFLYLPKEFHDKSKSIKMLIDCYAEVNEVLSVKEAEKMLPLTNLLTISLDSPNKNIGNAHNPKNDVEFFITKEKASYGFSPTEVMKGEWKVVISTHCILSDAVEMNLVVSAY